MTGGQFGGPKSHDILKDDPVKPSRIVLCGVVYASNLGDGIIADCMAYVLRKHWPATSVYHLDIATRVGYGEKSVTSKRRILALLRNSPGLVNKIIVAAGLKAFLLRKASPVWKDYFMPDDIVIIGGGHLLSDFNLNFPSKLALLSLYAHRAGARLGVHAVGVSAVWSTRATKLFTDLLTRCLLVSARDEQSVINLKQHLPQLEITASVARDPGYLAHLAYTNVVPKGKGVGLNFSNPDELAQYGKGKMHRSEYDRFWIYLMRTYLDRGVTITLFTNGAEEDEEYLDYLVSKAAALNLHGFERLPRPREPGELVAYIKGLDLMIGHRLHAQIIAFTHGIPAIALGWDNKLTSQMELMGRGDFLVPFARPDAKLVLKLGDIASERPNNPERVIELANDAEQSLVNAVSILALKSL